MAQIEHYIDWSSSDYVFRFMIHKPHNKINNIRRKAQNHPLYLSGIKKAEMSGMIPADELVSEEPITIRYRDWKEKNKELDKELRNKARNINVPSGDCLTIFPIRIWR